MACFLLLHSKYRLRMSKVHGSENDVYCAASDAPSTGLEDINVDVRSKFEMFEHFKERNKSPVGDLPAGPVKRYILFDFTYSCTW